jgi:F-type H+-transporting ATPase subunit epsilon
VADVSENVFEIEIATPQRLLAREKAIRAQIPAEDGYIGVLPDHASLISELGVGAMSYTTPGDQSFSLAVSGGFLEIHNNVVRVLTDFAEKAHEIDVSAAEKDLKQAQDAMINPALGIDIAAALIAVRHAQARIDAARKAANKEE